ncbi:DUF7547 family protein [Natrinema salifodinae]|uniref:Uncharacterized protein n=2 Tax=Natrinema salifodinae TaxID=1202768 RepID=A0A1I0N3E4_9EURY|nr:hypothetical protein [Natrinema salifodinae]SEV95546.1 hypothetical protein SAMN05216285_1296 [Natrinema salifodinae]
MADDRDDELADAVRDLARTIDELRRELDGQETRRRPPLRPPTPRELLRFTDEVALPAVLAVLETSVRALEAFQRALRIARTEREARERTTAAADATGERASELRETTLAQLETVLSELQRAATEGGLPADDRARDLLSEARELRDDVDRRLRDATDRETGTRSTATDRSAAAGDDPVEIDIEDGAPPDSDTDAATGADDDTDPDPSVDVDAELETLRDRYGPDEDTAEDEPGDSSERTGDDDDDSNDGGDGDDEPGSTGSETGGTGSGPR